MSALMSLDFCSSAFIDGEGFPGRPRGAGPGPARAQQGRAGPPLPGILYIYIYLCICIYVYIFCLFVCICMYLYIFVNSCIYLHIFCYDLVWHISDGKTHSATLPSLLIHVGGIKPPFPSRTNYLGASLVDVFFLPTQKLKKSFA